MFDDTCAVCQMANASEKGTDFDNTDKAVLCRRCGSYRTTSEAQDALRDKAVTNAQRANISGFLRDTTGYRFHSGSVPMLLNMHIPTLTEKGDRLLQFMAQTHSTPGALFSLQCDDLSTLARTRAWDSNELYYIALDYLVDGSQYLAASPAHRSLSNNALHNLKIAPRGWARLAELRQKPTTSNVGFIAMWFRPTLDVVRDHALIPAVAEAGYEPKVINLHEHANRIDDEIIALIRQSKFIVADFTGSRGGVYFEAGFALGLGLPVIWTCKRSTLEKGKLHFDVSHFNFIPWDADASGCDALRMKLQNRIEAVVGPGPLKALK